MLAFAFADCAEVHHEFSLVTDPERRPQGVLWICHPVGVDRIEIDPARIQNEIGAVGVWLVITGGRWRVKGDASSQTEAVFGERHGRSRRGPVKERCWCSAF